MNNQNEMTLDQWITARGAAPAGVPVDGKLYCIIGGHDCDHVTHEYARAINACAYPAMLESLEANAEGSGYVYFITRAEYLEYRQPPQRDLILEAHENGNPWAVAA
jgi:hypothetical protein